MRRNPFLQLVLLLAAVLWSSAAPLAAAACDIIQLGLIVEDESEAWPRDLAAGNGIRYDVLANDRDTRAGAVLTLGSPVVSHPIGIVTLTADGRALYFVPGAPDTYPGDGRYLSYTVASSAGGSKEGRVYFTTDTSTPAAQIKVTCQSTLCFFTAVPNGLRGVRSYDWTFRDAAYAACNKVDWRGQGIACSMSSTAASAWITLGINYYDGTKESVTQQVAWVSAAPKLEWSWFKDPADPNDPRQGTNGLAVAAAISCRLCLTCPTQNGAPIDELHFDWGETGTPVEAIYTQPCRGTGYPQVINHTYRAPGTYLAKAIVRQADGTTHEYPDNGIDPTTGIRRPAGLMVNVVNAAPIVRFENLTAGASDTARVKVSMWDDFSFTGRDPVNGPQRLEWDFGDGTIEVMRPPFPIGGLGVEITKDHVYKDKGKYVITVRAVDGHGAASTATSADYTIADSRPTAAFTYTCTGLRCRLDASASKDDVTIAAFEWAIGTAALITTTTAVLEQDVTAGMRPVTLTVRDDRGLRSDPFTRTVIATAKASPPLVYYSRAYPCRVFDSRAYSRKIPSGEGQYLAVDDIALACGISPTAKGFALNIVAIEPTGEGFITFDSLRPDGTYAQTSALNFNAVTAPRSNNVTIVREFPETPNISFTPTVFGTGGATHVVIDLVGFYETDPPQLAFSAPCAPPSLWCGPLLFRPVPHERLLDTRRTPPGIAAGGTLHVPVIGRGSILASLAPRALVANLTAVPDGDGYLVAYDSYYTSAQVTGVSSINYKTGKPHANGITTTIGTRTDRAHDLAVSAYFGATNATIDVTGMYVPKPTGGLRYYAVPTCRAFDTRLPELGGAGKLLNAQPIGIPIVGRCGVPATARAVLVHATAVRPAASGYLRLYPGSATAVPEGVVVVYQAGEVIGNTSVVEVATEASGGLRADATLFARDATAGTDLVLDIYGYFAP